MSTLLRSMRMKSLSYILLSALIVAITIVACKKTDYSFGKILTPANLTVTATLQGADATHPNGDGSGNVTIKATATNALGYKMYFGNGDSLYSTSGSVTYKYTTVDTNTYNISVNAIGTGGATSTMTSQVRILYVYVIPSDIVAALTNGSSAVWMIDKDTAGHFGVGPNTTFTADYYKAAPNEKPVCAYDDEITFKRVDSNTISMTVDNKGESFLIGASTAYYGVGGTADGCFSISTGGTKTLGFGAATSGSGPANSTGVQFTVPGNGIVDFGVGSTTYEILSLSSGIMMLRTIGIDGNAWYQILKAE